MDKLRIKFSKHGEMKYIGHLDVMRYFQKVMRRSGTDIAYTEGFSPHQKMSFALALGVGVESDAEYMDIEVNSLEFCGGSLKALKDKMNAVSAEGIEVLDIKILPEHSKNAMASVGAAAYEVVFSDEVSNKEVLNFDLKQAIEVFNNKDKVVVIKETKKKNTELDLKEHVFKLEYNPEKNAVYMLISAGSKVNIKPAMVMKTLFELSHSQENTDFDGEAFEAFKYRRLEIFNENLEPLCS